jgi:hypothetical protein
MDLSRPDLAGRQNGPRFRMSPAIRRAEKLTIIRVPMRVFA